jgi:alcohol dehydrogenase
MISAFRFAQMPAIEFGWNCTQTALADSILNASQSAVMLVVGQYVHDHFMTSRFEKVFAQRKVHIVVVNGEPSVDLIDQAVAQAPSDIELVVGFGGGSVLDAAKAIAGLLPERFSVLDYLEGVGCGRKIQQTPLPFIAVPTTAGTGSETTKNAVISRLGEFKKSFRDDRLLAKQAWLDPVFLQDCPPSVLYPTAMDALTQLIESYTTLKANPMTDALAWQGLSLFKGAFELIASADNTNRQEGFGRLMLAASLSGMTLANAGLGAVHGLAGPIGAYFKAPHGLVCAKLLAPIVANNIRALEQENTPRAEAFLLKYQQIARLLASTDDLAGLVDYLDKLASRYIQQGLREFGLNERNLQPIIDTCRAGSMLGNPIVLSDETLIEALYRAL